MTGRIDPSSKVIEFVAKGTGVRIIRLVLSKINIYVLYTLYIFLLYIFFVCPALYCTYFCFHTQFLFIAVGRFMLLILLLSITNLLGSKGRDPVR